MRTIGRAAAAGTLLQSGTLSTRDGYSERGMKILHGDSASEPITSDRTIAIPGEIPVIDPAT